MNNVRRFAAAVVQIHSRVVTVTSYCVSRVPKIVVFGNLCCLHDIHNYNDYCHGIVEKLLCFAAV